MEKLYTEKIYTEKIKPKSSPVVEWNKIKFVTKKQTPQKSLCRQLFLTNSYKYLDSNLCVYLS